MTYFTQGKMKQAKIGMQGIAFRKDVNDTLDPFTKTHFDQQ